MLYRRAVVAALLASASGCSGSAPSQPSGPGGDDGPVTPVAGKTYAYVRSGRPSRAERLFAKRSRARAGHGRSRRSMLRFLSAGTSLMMTF